MLKTGLGCSREVVGSILAKGVLMLALCAAGTLALASARTRADADAEARAKARPVLEKFQQSPAVFIENQGQWEDASVRFTMNSMGCNVGLTSASVRFQLFQREAEPGQRMGPMGPIRQIGQMEKEAARDAAGGESDRRNAVRRAAKMKQFAMRFEGARAAPPVGEGKSEQVFHYRSGEASRWRENVASWNAVVYRGLWEGIDLRVRGRRAGVKYEFLVAPGADWRKIRLRYEGVEELKLRGDGSLELLLGKGWQPLVDGAPFIYQDAPGGRKTIAGKYALMDARTCGYEITGPFDPALPLMIDPELVWSTYLGGNSGDDGKGIAVDGAGNVFVTGFTYSSGWVSGGFDTTYNGGFTDVFVAKLSKSGAHLWSTYLGGIYDEQGFGIAVDSTGNVFVTGFTGSPGWVSGGFDTTDKEASNAFVAKLSGSGLHLWSTYLGGNDCDEGYGIAVDGAGNVFVTGETWSSAWVSGGFDTTHNGNSDAFVAALSGSGAHLWSTYLGGSNYDSGKGIAVDGAGNVLVTGITQSSGWVSGGFNTTLIGGAFVVKLSGSGSHLWSTYLGGDSGDEGRGIAADGAGNVFVTGMTYSSGWVSGGFDTTYNGGGRDAFVAELSGSGAHLWSTYLGGSELDQGRGITVNGAGNVFVTGETLSSGWVSGGFDTTFNGGYDAFVAELSGSGAHLWSTYVGGSSWDWGSGIAVDGTGNVSLTGGTMSSGWVSGGFDTTYNDAGYGDGFVAKITDGPPLTGSLCVTITPPACVAAGARWRFVGTSIWLDSGHTETELPTALYAIEFKSIPEWVTPASRQLQIRDGQILRVVGLYRRTGIAGVVNEEDTAGTPVPGVRLRTDDYFHSVLTDEQGLYCFEIPSGASFSGTVRPWLSKETDDQGRIIRRVYVFEPPSRVYDAVTTDTPNQDYTGDEIDTPGDLVAHFFNRVLDRAPTADEYYGWSYTSSYIGRALSNNVDVRIAVREMARSLFLSQEYTQRNRTDAQFIEDCYRAFVWREPTEEELADWLGGVWTRPEALSVFWKSREFSDGMESLFPGQRGEAARNCVAAMYIGAIHRVPDAQTLWRRAETLTQASDKRAAIRAIAREFFGSAPFPGGISSQEKVNRLYYALMGRCPGSGELAYWSAMLDSGALSLEQAVDAFMGSWEMVNVLRGLFDGFRATPAAATAWEIYE